MVIVMKPDAEEADIQHASDRLEELGFQVHRVDGIHQTLLGAIGDKRGVERSPLETMPSVRQVVEISEPYKLASREFKDEDTTIQFNGTEIGGRELIAMAGPCSVEDEDQIHRLAELSVAQGAKVLRGGAFKPRTSPYSFQGLGEQGLKWMREAADEHGLLMVTEVMDPTQTELVASYADILQIGARNMQNYHLLCSVGQVDQPVLIKRGLAAKLKEFLMAAEYVMSEGNHRVILCERGVRTFLDHMRFTLDVGAIPVIKERSHLPIVVDPSHAAGVRDYVKPLALSAVAAGADGLIMEIHDAPELAVSDGNQALTPDMYAELMRAVGEVAHTVGRTLDPSDASTVPVQL